MKRVNRRVFVRSAAAFACALPLLSWSSARAEPGLRFGKAKAFSFDALVERARVLAQKAYKPPPQPNPALVGKIDYEAHGRLRFKVDRALDGSGPGAYPTTFFHLGAFFQKSVKMFHVDGEQAREVLYTQDDFDMPADSVARKLPRDAGFAGFHVHESRTRADWKTQDWLAFLGASYFRSIGSLNQYGLSARGIAVNTTVPGVSEEFPDFTEFYLQSPEDDSEPMVICALLDGPSVCGAYRFVCSRKRGVIMDVDSALFFRNDIAQLGIAPITSMFWFSEYDKRMRADWRPEVHDSDGLLLWTGVGERLWRPLNNPQRVVTSSFVDRNPRGFGLMQRDRNADHYLDGVLFEQRPSLWVEPLEPWGEGAVQLIEMETLDETNDNVVAFWLPKQPVKKGGAYRCKYRLYWQAFDPWPREDMATVFATRIGRGGQPGKARPVNAVKFVVEFAGRTIQNLPRGAPIRVNLTASRGTFSNTFCEPVPRTDRWRASFDLNVEGNDVVELRAFLLNNEKTASETWAYQYEPRT